MAQVRKLTVINFIVDEYSLGFGWRSEAWREVVYRVFKLRVKKVHMKSPTKSLIANKNIALEVTFLQ